MELITQRRFVFFEILDHCQYPSGGLHILKQGRDCADLESVTSEGLDLIAERAHGFQIGHQDLRMGR